MNSIFKLIQNYLIYGFPFVLGCMAWGTIVDEANRTNTFVTKWAWEILSWNLIVWFGILVIFLVSIVLWPEAREKTLKRLANIKDRDEREELITGQASRVAYVSSLSLVLLFLFFSIFSLNISRLPAEEAINGKTGTLSIGLGFSLVDKPRIETHSITGQILFETKDLPLSKTGILMALLVWQLVTFNVAARRENRKGVI